MTKYAAKVDANQGEIIAALNAAGATVQPLHKVGMGCPDLLVSYQGVTFLIEVIGPDKRKRFPPDGLSPNQRDWHSWWDGPVYTAGSVEEALAVLGGLPVVPLRGVIS